MGLVGSGKTQFIKDVTGRTDIIVGDDLRCGMLTAYSYKPLSC